MRVCFIKYKYCYLDFFYYLCELIVNTLELMNISFKHLSEHISTDTSWFRNSTNIADRDISVLMLCILYHNNKISRESFTSRMNRYRSSDESVSLTRVVGTYKSKILNQWYSGVCVTNVYVEEVIGSCVGNTDLTIKEYLKYLNIGFNRNVNYCVDYLAFSIFKPIMEHYDKGWSYRFLTSCNIDGVNGLEYLSFDQADMRHDLSSGYCCEDHDGPIEDYKRMRYDYLYSISRFINIQEKRNVVINDVLDL